MAQNSTYAPISVVIPARNEGRYIQQAIESVLQQTLPGAEIIVVADDCSDDTASIASKLSAKVVEINARSISAARNAGIRKASQPWIALLDADDYWKPNKIQRQWQAVQRFPDAGVVSCDYYTILNGKIGHRSKKEIKARRETLLCPVVTFRGGAYYPRVDGKVLRLFDIAPQAAMVRSDVFDTAGFFDEAFAYLQDVEFFARALRDHPLVMIEAPLVYRRLRPDSHSQNSEGKWSAYLAIVDRMLKHPETYVPMAGEQYRDHIKMVFASNERLLAAKKSGSANALGS